MRARKGRNIWVGSFEILNTACIHVGLTAGPCEKSWATTAGCEAVAETGHPLKNEIGLTDTPLRWCSPWITSSPRIARQEQMTWTLDELVSGGHSLPTEVGCRCEPDLSFLSPKSDVFARRIDAIDLGCFASPSCACSARASSNWWFFHADYKQSDFKWVCAIHTTVHLSVTTIYLKCFTSAF